MKGVVFLGDKECEVREFPDPVPNDGEVRVKMMASGICGSDLHLYRGDSAWAKERGDRIPGHEPCGVVDAIGTGVAKVKEGDRVTVYHYLGCGYCAQCASGNLMWCGEASGYGGPVDGSHADYIIADERNCVKMPDTMRFTDGAFIACPAGTAYSSLSKLEVRPGDNVAVFGLGPVGLSSIILATAMGGNIIGLDIIDERLKLAEQAGAATVVDVGKNNAVEAIRAFTSNDGIELDFETSGSPKGREGVVACLQRGGKSVFVGIGSMDKVINPSLLISKQLTLMGSFVLPLWMAWKLVDVVTSQSLSFDWPVTHRYRIEDAPEAYRTFDAGGTGKVVFEWD